MGISSQTQALLQKVFAELWPRTGWTTSSRPSLIMLGRQDSKAVGKEPEAVFQDFGFGNIASLDVTDSEGATIVHDLNQPIPMGLTQRFDCVYDGGTLEHVFDVKAAMFNIHNLLKPGGVVLHSNPVNNFINHGFYQFSPAFYHGFYDQNAYTLERLYLTVTYKDTDLTDEIFCEVSGEGLNNFGLGTRLILPPAFTPEHMLAAMFIARKPGIHNDPLVPQQPFYSERYAGPEYDRFKKLIRFPSR